MKALESFTKKVEPKRRQSKLKKYENEIKELYKKGYKVEQIKQFLEKNKIEVEIWGIYKFLKLNKNLSTQNFSFKNPSALKKQEHKKIGKQEREEDKALNAFLIDCQQTAESIKNYEEKKDDIHSSKQ